jgi:hypothetical protein
LNYGSSCYQTPIIFRLDLAPGDYTTSITRTYSKHPTDRENLQICCLHKYGVIALHLLLSPRFLTYQLFLFYNIIYHSVMICQQVFLILSFLLINVPLPIFACPTGFIQSSINPTNCYYIGKQQSDIFDAIVDCSVQAKNAGFTTAYVASIHSAFESEEIRCTRVIILN